MAALTSARVGDGFWSISALAEITMPGMQKPHCTAPADANAWAYTAFSRGESPSTVSTFFPPSLATSVTQARRFTPSMSTVHAPQAPTPQAFLTEVSRSSSRRKSISFPRSAVTARPFTVNEAISHPHSFVPSR